MREILFRGKTTDTGKWIEGFYFYKYRTQEHGIHCSISMGVLMDRAFEVIPETIGQFTGLTDKNGKKAYSGDVYRDSHGTIRTIWTDQGGFRTESNPLSFGYGSQGNSNPSLALADQQAASWFEGNCEIIGNIHDNPELSK